MDPHRFDALVRSLTVTGSRRTALAVALGGVLTQLGPDAGAHDARRRCQKIEDREKRKKCLKRARRHNAQHGASCQGRNVCVQGEAAACGAAGNTCYCWTKVAGGSVCGGNEGAFVVGSCAACEELGRICVRGGDTNCPGPFVCVLPCCPPGFRECNGRCVDVLRDANNCGACGRVCGPDRPNVSAGGSCCIDAGGGTPCSCAPAGGACRRVGNACCANGASCTNGVCP